MAKLLDKIFVALLFIRGQGIIKIKASTLVETLVASVIIITVFSMASLTLNAIFKNSVHSNTRTIDAHLNKLMYLNQHGKLEMNYQDNFNEWEIIVSKQSAINMEYTVFAATHNKTQKKVIKKIINATAE